ncbi:YlbL family protein [Microlunatus flavus]|uniref:endopeptidase La n=1 Tax=Microlunatus flavus TaxID=1036181 RepID=A0A1H9I116_9ACTN|nr:S16 family serine protease [Microlunatus flavus]SEQ68233.1 PDZ domain-containing protein [Microlunatus flavus]
MRRSALTRQTVTAFAAAAAFVVLAVLVAVLPVPYVTWSPGTARDVLATGGAGTQPIIAISDVTTYPTEGRLDMTVVSTTAADSRLSLPQALVAYFRPDHDALPREAVYPAGRSAEDVEDADAEMMVSAQDDAVVAALRASQRPVEQLPAIASVTVGSPAQGHLRPGDLVVSVDGTATPTPALVQAAVRQAQAGRQLTFVVLRDKVRVSVPLMPAPQTSGTGVQVGITLGTGYAYTPRISYDLGQKIGGPSAGLVFALAIYDKLTPGALFAGQHVAGTGTINPTGVVGGIGGIQEKIAGAQAAGATTFLVPAPNCGDLAGVRTTMRLVRVATLNDAIRSVRSLDSPAAADALPTC